MSHGQITHRINILLADPTRKTPLIVLIDGRSGSGKSTLAKHAAQELTHAGTKTELVTIDNFYEGWRGLKTGVERTAQMISDLREHGQARVQTWDWYEQKPGPVRTYRADGARVYLIEGVGAASRSAVKLADLTVWIDCAARLREHRATERDHYMDGARWLAWAYEENLLYATENPTANADLIIRNNAHHH